MPSLNSPEGAKHDADYQLAKMQCDAQSNEINTSDTAK